MVEAKYYKYMAMCDSKLKRSHLDIEESLLRDIGVCVEINQRLAS